MPHKVGFVVISSSGHEDGFSAKELMVHAPTVNGWRSPRLCQYPQEITLQLVERCRIRKLQLLAHQYMIPSKIEFFISESLPEYFAPYQSERFHRLGYVPLSDNEKTGFKARELKSVYMDAVGQYLKLIFHKNYVNKYNLYSQVALVAINVIGDPADYSNDSNKHPSREKLIDHYLGIKSDDPALDGTYLGKSDSISPLDDLAFDMYQDPEVAQIIRRLDEKKHEAVHQERYDYAKKLKQAIADLQKVGERLGRYEVEKRYAVEKEDYDLAKKKKQQMDAYRLKVYQQLQLHNLLDAELMTRKPPDLPVEPVVYDSLQHTKATSSPSCENTELQSSQGELWKAESLLEEKPTEPNSPEPVFLHQSTPPTLSHPTTSREVFAQEEVEFLPYDERPLPAIHKHSEEAVRYLEPEKTEGDISNTPRSGITGEPEPLSEKALREASPAIEVFGEALVSGAYSKSWSYREDALLAVYKKLMEMAVSTPKEDLKNMLRAAIFLVRRAIKDIVSSVFQASLKLLKMLITQYVPKHKLGKLETSHCVEKTLPGLLSRTGDSSSRLRIMAAKFIQFATGALEHRVYEVRDVALRIIFDMYRKHKAAILEYLPPDDASIRKTVLYKTLFDGFTKIDGKLSEAEMRAQKKAATEEAERQKKAEIKVLQGQLAALREIQAEVQAGKEKESDFQKTKDQGYKSPQPAAAEIPDDHSSVANYLDNLCIFCGERNESFTEEGLDLHYWKRCPMLTRCEHCKQVVEIASLTEHLLTECDKKDSFGKCQRCSEAFPKDELLDHIKSKTCNAAKPENVANHCPLCHDNFSPGEEAWKSHLMGTDGCAMNLRRLSTINKTIPMQPGKTGGHYLKKPSPSMTKVRPPSIGSKIPTPRGGPNKSSGKTYSKQ
ncbi:centrosomal protein of 104 kDa isoform X2 [Meleagris gallopavo]|uniref:centrosomal protein of 104 kDa isoform X2 n=1 Tax=Meleagris gallopavo TaxID=9103 RepID=UPI0012AB3F34|nr:centrosomal protein of 104 kDa isoform X2 [Meleagris gallopavo]